MNFAQTSFSRQLVWEIARILPVGIVRLLFYLAVILLAVLFSAIASAHTSLRKAPKNQNSGLIFLN